MLLGASAAFGQLQYALNRIWDVKVEARSDWRRLPNLGRCWSENKRPDSCEEQRGSIVRSHWR